MCKCRIHKEPTFGSKIFEKLAKLGRKPTKDPFNYGEIGRGPQRKGEWTETAVLKIVDPACLECLKEARLLGELLEYDGINLFAIMPEAPRLETYLKGGLYSWNQVIDADNRITKRLVSGHPTSHSTFIISQDEVVSSFDGKTPKELVKSAKKTQIKSIEKAKKSYE